MFKDEDISGLKTIECLKKTGMPIKDIKHFMDCCMEGDSTIGERLSIMKSQRDDVVEQIKEMQEMLDMLNFKCWYYETAKEAVTCSIHDNIQIKNVPKEYHKYLHEKIVLLIIILITKALTVPCSQSGFPLRAHLLGKALYGWY